MSYSQGAGRVDWLTRLDELVAGKTLRPALQSIPSGASGQGVATGSGGPNPQQSHLFKQVTRVLKTLARQAPLVLLVDDLQWADAGSINMLFHLGRRLAGSRILIVGAYRREEVALGRPVSTLRAGGTPPSGGQGGDERHPLAPVVNELQQEFGDVAVNVDRSERRAFVDAFLDSPASPLAPNRLGISFRELLYRHTRGHPLFTVELLRGMQERGDLVRDSKGRWVEGPTLNWETLPARVEAAIAERIGRLAQPLRGALRVASVEGEDFTAEVMARVLGIDEREMVRRLSSELDRRHHLVRAQVIERLGAQRVSRYRFRNYLFQKYLYDSLDPVERAYLHEDVGDALEGLYRNQPSQIATVAPQLARHFQEAGIAEKAIHYLHQAGERAVQLSAYQEGIAHLTRGLALLETLPDPAAEGGQSTPDQRLERAQQELDLQLSLGIAWMPDESGITEVVKAYTRARDLCQQTGQVSQLCRIQGQLATMCYVRAEYRRARELGEEALNLAQQAEDPLLVALTHWRLGFTTFALGEYTTARDHLQHMIAFYEPEHHHPLVLLSGANGGLSALAYDACCLWCLGYPDQAQTLSQEVLALARELDHPFTLADVVCFAGCMFGEMRRDAQALLGHAEELMRLASEKGMPTWLPYAVWHRGEALAKLGQVQEGMAQMRKGMAQSRSTEERLYLPSGLMAVAEAQAKVGQPEQGLVTLAEGLALVEETGERHWEAELYRMKGELLLTQGAEAEAERQYRQAIEVARRQCAKSWELRAATSLARLWQRQAKMDEARQLLAEVYGWFTEGFDTPDLKEAKALLDELT